MFSRVKQRSHNTGRNEGWGFECEGESGVGRSSRGIWGLESAEFAGQKTKYGLHVKRVSHGRVLRSASWSASHLRKKTLDCSMGHTANEIKG